MRKLASILSWRQAKRLVVAVIGTTVVLLGLVMMLTPGPGLLVIIAGLGILATEFVWARHLLKQVKDRSKDAMQRAKNGFRRAEGKTEEHAAPPPPPPACDPCAPGSAGSSPPSSEQERGASHAERS